MTCGRFCAAGPFKIPKCSGRGFAYSYSSASTRLVSFAVNATPGSKDDGSCDYILNETTEDSVDGSCDYIHNKAPHTPSETT